MLTTTADPNSGATSGPTREFIAKAIKARNADRVLVPAAGRFSVVETLLGVGVDRSKIYASDVGLYPSILGYLADPRHTVAELGLEFPAYIPPQPSTGDPEFDLAAQAVLLLELSRISPTYQKGLYERAEVLRNWAEFHSSVVAKLRALIKSLAGIHYDIADMWDVIAGACASDAMFCNIPTKAGAARAGPVNWIAPEHQKLDDSMFRMVVDKIVESGAMALVACHAAVHYLPAGWQVVMAEQLTRNVTDYLISSFDTGGCVALQKIASGPTHQYPVFCDEEITATSSIEVVKVDAQTGLYYRDLFVHKLGSTSAEEYYLLLIDGRVVTTFGLYTSDVRRFATDYVLVFFSITKSSARYKRLVKLFELAITCGEMRQYLILSTAYGVREPVGVQTTNLTNGPESMISRGVLKFHSREKMPGGRYKVKYRGLFRDDTFQQCLSQWVERYASNTPRPVPLGRRQRGAMRGES